MRLSCVLVLAALVGFALPAQAAERTESRTVTIRLISVTTRLEVRVDRAPKNEPSRGDVFWARSTLRNEVAQFGRARGALVGSDVTTYSVVSATRADVKATVRLPGGTLRVAGRASGERVVRLRVVGGTGAFAGARGTCDVSALNATGERSRNVYRLQLP